MNNRIHKDMLVVTDRQIVTAPIGAKFLTVQVQPNLNRHWVTVNHTNVSLWFQVDIDLETKVDYDIRMYGTGNPMPDDPGEYIGTFQLGEGELVFHVYNKGPVTKENSHANQN